jgi:hypothetical protein
MVGAMRGRGATLSLALGFMVVAVSGCASIDPTEQFFAISFTNDLPRTMVLRACSDNACQHIIDTWHLKPGGTANDNISDRNVLTRWQIQGVSGAEVGCLPLSFGAKYAHVVVRLSQAVSCPGAHALPLGTIGRGKRLGGET